MLVQGLFAWAVWSLTKRFVSTDSCTKCREKIGAEVAAMQSRQTALESTIRELPSKTELHELALTMKDLQGELKAMQSSVETLKTMTNRQEEFLLSGAAK
jgi:ABC-type phosphate transport system auxiliary subunit